MHMHYYKIFLAMIFKWFATIYSTVAGIGFSIIMIDLLFYHKWGYPWHAAPFALLLFCVGWGIRAVAIFALKRIEKP